MSEIRVEIKGEPGSGKTLVGNVIQKSLEDAGFANITHLDQNNDPIEPIDVITILDLVQQSRPDLFDTQITISEHNMTEDELDLIAIQKHQEIEEALLLADVA